MPAGIEIYDTSGKLTIGTNYRGLRLIRLVSFADLTGSVTIEHKDNEEVLAYAVPYSADIKAHTTDVTNVSVDGNKVSWEVKEWNNMGIFGFDRVGKVNIYIFGRAK